ncbi:MAG: hypothetical protein QNL04_15600 [SAR324 cluster bacterium]|nr:hypothetical protein [SAR324 cluster bacterium]
MLIWKKINFIMLIFFAFSNASFAQGEPDGTGDRPMREMRVLSQLDLSVSQQKKIEKIEKNFDKKHFEISQKEKALMFSMRRSISSVLSKSQKAKLTKFREDRPKAADRQSCGHQKARKPSHGMRMLDFAGLSATQQKKIEASQKELDKKRFDLHQKAKELKNMQRRSILAVLSKSQKAKFFKIKNDTFLARTDMPCEGHRGHKSRG